MKMRTTQPHNNPYYMRKASGGYSNAVKGCPTIKDADVLCNCVGYANSRYAEIQDLGYIKYQLVCNAENFIEKAKSMGLEISAVPVLGGIMVWQRGATLADRDGAGHVAVVEKVINAGQIITSESGWNAWAFKTVTRSNSNGRWGQSSAYKFRGCIVNPAIGRKGAEDIKSITVDGEWGVMTTLFSQQIMKTFQDGFVSGQLTSCKKYLPNALTSSWEFSANGKGSELIKAIQRLVGAKADGFAGQNTIKALQSFLKAHGLYSGAIDGIMGANTVKGWQKWLNNPTYKKSKAQEINDKAIELAWAKGTDKSKYAYNGGSACKAFKVAWQKCYPKKTSNAGCHQYVSLVLNVLGYGSMPMVKWAEILSWLDKRFKRISFTYKESQLKAGDIWVRMDKDKSGKKSYHILFIVEIDGKLMIAEAQRKKTYSHINTSISKALKHHTEVWVYRAV